MPALAEEPWVRHELNFPGEIGRGDRHSERGPVTRVQEWVSYHGFVTSVDGDFGPATEKAVRKFQTERNLSQTGHVDQMTFNALVAPLAAALVSPTPQPANLTQAVVTFAKLHLRLRPVEIGGANCGPWVRFYMKGREGRDWLWCAGFACTIVRQASELLGVRSPVTYEVSCDRLAQEAKRQQAFLEGKSLIRHPDEDSSIQPGSLFLLQSTRNEHDWIHTGIVIEADSDSFSTIEGNTNAGGSANGFEVCQRERGYNRTDFFMLGSVNEATA